MAGIVRACLFVAVASLAVGCTSVENNNTPSGLDSSAGYQEAGILCQDPNGDADEDGINNGLEGCLSGRNSDNDEFPDWQDYDSDGDGISDAIEAGKKDAEGHCAALLAPHNQWPCDTDDDNFPDYLDLDSDGDGLYDQDEDPSGDGLLGCCLTSCGQTGSEWQKVNCLLTEDGCGSGQSCENGQCSPSVNFQCSQGETDPRKKDTFSDGKLDKERGTFICRPATEDQSGRQLVQPFISSLDTGDWHIALRHGIKYSELLLDTTDPKETAAVFDDQDSAAEVAGFVISRNTTSADIQAELTPLLDAIGKRVPGGPGSVSVRSAGTESKSHDRYDSVQGTILDLELSTPSSVSNVRNELVGILLDKPMGKLGNLPSAFGATSQQMIIRFVIVRRYNFKVKQGTSDELELDEKGYPIDDGDKKNWRLIIMGAVSAREKYDDATQRTGVVVEDLSNGTALATANDRIGDECDVGILTFLPIADIIWVVDESGSMILDRLNVVKNAKAFFSRALSAGLDFRMGVTNVCDPDGQHSYAVGKFCSKKSTNSSDDGGEDRFLLHTESDLFSACIENPPGMEGGAEYGLTNSLEAVKRHLPRAAGIGDRIRPEAKLAIILLTDEAPQELKDGILEDSDLSLPTLHPTKQAAVNAALQPYINYFTGTIDPEAVASFHLIGGLPNTTGAEEVAHGYLELARALGGEIGDITQQDLGNTMQVIIDSIVADTSPVELEYVPISSSLAVTLDGEEIPRSRTKGFDYRSKRNTLVFMEVPFVKGSEVIASYYRWMKQIILE